MIYPEHVGSTEAPETPYLPSWYLLFTNATDAETDEENDKRFKGKKMMTVTTESQ